MNSASFLGKPITRDYIPSAYVGTGWNYINRTPPFSLRTVSDMLTDSRVVFGLWLIKGPIASKSRFFVDCENKEVKEFLIKNISRFWRNSAVRALKCVEWGYACSESIYKVEKQQIHFHTLKDLHPVDCRVLTKDGAIVGANIHNLKGKGAQNTVTLPATRMLWTLHGREFHQWYGRSRLFGAYLPWIEAWTDGGFRDSRRLYFHKYAFDGGTMYHPPGITRLSNSDGSVAQTINNKQLARELLEKRKNGGSLTLPNTLLDGAARAWEWQPTQAAAVPAGLMEYGDALKDEIWEGMGIPPEIARAEGTGAYAGRLIPQQAFHAILQEVLFWLISDADEQIFRKLVEFNFGPEIDYEIIPFSLLDAEDQEDAGGQPAEQASQTASLQQARSAKQSGMSHFLEKNGIDGFQLLNQVAV